MRDGQREQYREPIEPRYVEHVIWMALKRAGCFEEAGREAVKCILADLEKSGWAVVSVSPYPGWGPSGSASRLAVQDRPRRDGCDD